LASCKGDQKSKITDWVKVAGESNEAFKVIGVEEKYVVLHTGCKEPIEKVETIDLNKYDIASHIVHHWYEKG